MQDTDFLYQTRVSFYDTDAMGVMHHASYLKKFEDARVDWLRHEGLDRHHFPQKDIVLAVIKVEVSYIKPCRFEQLLNIQLKFKKTRLKLSIEYAMFAENSQLVATATTVHVPLDSNLQLQNYPEAMLEAFKRNIKNG